MDVIYFKNTEGYLARPETTNGAGVIIIHEFWGLDDQIKKTADKIAAEGFTVLAIDLYEGRKATDREEAQKLKASVITADAVKNIEGGIDYLRRTRGIAREKTAVWGFCFGGGIAFDAVSYPTTMGAAIIYYGPVSDDAGVIEKIECPILGIFGAKDHAITPDLVQRFHKTIDQLKKTHEIYLYPDAGHAFANKERENYHEQSAKDAWQKTITFLKKHLVR